MLDERASAVDFYEALRTKVPDWPDPHIPAELIRYHVFGAEDPNERVTAKLHAVNALCVNESWATDWLSFISIVLSLNGIPVDIEMLETPLVGHLAYAMRDIRVLRAKCGHSMPTISDDVGNVIRAACKAEGLLRYPEELREYEPARTHEEQADISVIDRALQIARERHDIDWSAFPKDIMSYNVLKLSDIEDYCAGKH